MMILCRQRYRCGTPSHESGTLVLRSRYIQLILDQVTRQYMIVLKNKIISNTKHVSSCTAPWAMESVQCFDSYRKKTVQEI